MIWVFWITVLLLATSYLLYPAAMILLAPLFPRREVRQPQGAHTATLLIPAHNEEAILAEKLENSLDQKAPQAEIDVLVVSDGSQDATVSITREYADRGVRLMEITPQQGKINALNQAVGSLTTDFVVFSDANSLLSPGSVANLLRHFGDPAVGGACGELGVPESGRRWLGLGEHFYWKYDHALKRAESRLGGAVSAQGSLYAMRRELFEPIPDDCVDDAFISLTGVAKGRRLVQEPSARTAEAVSSKISKEFGRRVRAVEMGVRVIWHYKQLLSPLRFGFYSIQLWLHKVLRRLTPLLLPVLFAASIAVVNRGPVYWVALAGQVIVYGAALMAWLIPVLRRSPVFSVAFFFVLTHAAMGLGVLRFMTGRRTTSWKPVR